jgi:alpha-beta hydrolase superfamily lysophospholipase
VLLCTPADRKGPFPVVVAVHGLTSNKAQVCAQVAPGLTKRGFAVIAADMPRHGERPGDPMSVINRSDLAGSFVLSRRAVNDVRQCIDVAETRPELDTKAGVTLVGYSMGSWIGSVAGPADDRVKAMVLMVGGAADVPAAALLLPQVAAVDPRMAIAHFAGRPVLMLNGKSDNIVKKDMADRLFAACPEPKKQVWYDCGHLLTGDAYEDATKWVAETIAARGKDAPVSKKAG